MENKPTEKQLKYWESLKGKQFSPLTQFKKGIIPFMKGKKQTKESNEKNRLSHLGNVGYWKDKKRNPETIEKIRQSQIGSIPWNKGLKGAQVAWNKGLKGVQVGWNKGLFGLKKPEEHYNWKGGISRFPYSLDWTETLRRSIRERDNYTCQICGNEQGDRVHSVHHIDYDKNNCNPDNLITLCISCHIKTNHNRDYWIEYFKQYEYK